MARRPGTISILYHSISEPRHIRSRRLFRESLPAVSPQQRGTVLNRDGTLPKCTRERNVLWLHESIYECPLNTMEQSWNSPGSVQFSHVATPWNSPDQSGTGTDQSRNAHENAMYRDLIIILLKSGNLEQSPTLAPAPAPGHPKFYVSRILLGVRGDTFQEHLFLDFSWGRGSWEVGKFPVPHSPV